MRRRARYVPPPWEAADTDWELDRAPLPDAEAVARAGQLKRVWLNESCTLTEEAAEWLGRLLERCTSLRRLEIWHGNKMDDGVRPFALQASRSTLREIRIFGNGLGAADARMLSVAVARSPVLESLDLEWNHVGDEGARWLGAAASVSTSLRDLDLSSNHVTDAGARYVAAGVARCRTMTTLRLAHNLIADVGCLLPLVDRLERIGAFSARYPDPARARELYEASLRSPTLTALSVSPDEKVASYERLRVLYRALLAFLGEARATPLRDFARRDGDHRVAHRVAEMLIS